MISAKRRINVAIRFGVGIPLVTCSHYFMTMILLGDPVDLLAHEPGRQVIVMAVLYAVKERVPQLKFEPRGGEWAILSFKESGWREELAPAKDLSCIRRSLRSITRTTGPFAWLGIGKREGQLTMRLPNSAVVTCEVIGTQGTYVLSIQSNETAKESALGLLCSIYQELDRRAGRLESGGGGVARE